MDLFTNKYSWLIICGILFCFPNALNLMCNERIYYIHCFYFVLGESTIGDWDDTRVKHGQGIQYCNHYTPRCTQSTQMHGAWVRKGDLNS